MKCQSLVVVHEGQQPNLFDNWADASLRLPLAVMLPLSVIAKYDSWEVLTDTTATLKVAIYKIGRWTPPLPPHKLAIIPFKFKAEQILSDIFEIWRFK